MLDSRLPRAPLWGSVTTLAVSVILLSQGVVQHPSIGRTAPLLSALALASVVLAWRLLHRELQRRALVDARLRERMQRLEDAIQYNVDGMLLLRAVRTADGELADLEITEANSSAAALCRRTPATLVGLRLRRDLQSQYGDAIFGRYAEVVQGQMPLVEDIRVDRRRFTAAWLKHQVIPTSDGVAVTIRDITAGKREELRLRKASLTDDLTRLYNRRGFMALAEQQLRVARRQGKDAVVLYADMDDFKRLNDLHGHGVGDRALQAVARVLTSTVRECDVVARLGGDEFTILALDADGAGARSIQKRIEEHLTRLNERGELPVPIALTIGHTRVRPADPASVVELLARADVQLYERKRRRQMARVSDTVSVAIDALEAAPDVPGHALPRGRSARNVAVSRRGHRITAVPAEVAAVAAAMATARGLLPSPAITGSVPSSLTPPAPAPHSMPLPPTHAA